MKREWLRIKPSLFPLLMISILLPIVIYIVIGFPFYSVIKTFNGMKYMYWISPGIWIFVSALIGFFLTLDGINNLLIGKRQIEPLCSMPITNRQILIGILTWSILMSVIQWIISILLTSLLNNEFFKFNLIIRLFIQSFPAIIFYTGLGALLAIITSNKYWQITFSMVCFILLGFGFGCFIPLQFFPDELISFLELIPVTSLISGAHDITFQNSGSFTGGLFSFISGVLFILVSFGLSNKRFRI
ncbi:MAG: hypothetical protein CMF96_09090 [Candidatus Marinimicrobia bacterium]|nr:hypothetical protein [Candidatus Neomarinimicrobiota bacterium]|tara:strand:- start:903 stop:1634 length:732 start_codon:yes stop_codon:yes gene_type:complete